MHLSTSLCIIILKLHISYAEDTFKVMDILNIPFIIWFYLYLVSISSAATSVVISNQICHVDTVEVSLCGDHKGVGLTVDGGPPEGITVYSIQPGSAAERW